MSDSYSSQIQSSRAIAEAIRRIALKGLIQGRNGTVRGTQRVSGYVAKIHEDGELAGTVDVQEYADMAYEDTEEAPIGYHEGVYLSALQDNSKGYVIIPKLYSEVVIAADPETGVEYVCMFSHVDQIQLDAHETITVGVKEREDFDESDENSPDVHELEETGTFSQTTYVKDSITTEVHKEKDSHISQQFIDGENYTVSVDDEQTTLSMDKDKVDLVRDTAELQITKDDITESVGSSKVKVTDGTVYLGSDSGTDDAVLGKELAGILSEFLQYMGQMMTTTMMGPQPPINVASFIALKAKIDAFKASSSGFLTKKVQVQK